jgi:hypothetical protein
VPTGVSWSASTTSVTGVTAHAASPQIPRPDTSPPGPPPRPAPPRPHRKKRCMRLHKYPVSALTFEPKVSRLPGGGPGLWKVSTLPRQSSVRWNKPAEEKLRDENLHRSGVCVCRVQNSTN